MKGKILGVAIATVLGFSIMLPNAKAFATSDWTAGTGYGSATAVDSNITNIKGEAVEADGMKKGPYTKVSKQTLKDGIKESVNIELKKEDFANSELFELSVSLDDETKNYVTESVIMTQKVGDEFQLTFNSLGGKQFTIKEDGIYTYEYEYVLKDGKVYARGAVLNYGEVLFDTGLVDMKVAASDRLAQYSTRSVWFCNIKADNGVNVYENLPAKELTPATPVEKPEVKPEVKPDETVTENPKTFDGLMSYILIATITGSTLVIASRKVLKNN